jgi:hypothetical protein
LEGLGTPNVDIFILLSFEIFYCPLVYFVVIWFIMTHFGMFYQERSGNPELKFFSTTLAGFDLTTHNSAGGDDTTRPRRTNLEVLFFNTCSNPQTIGSV